MALRPSGCETAESAGMAKTRPASVALAGLSASCGVQSNGVLCRLMGLVAGRIVSAGFSEIHFPGFVILIVAIVDRIRQRCFSIEIDADPKEPFERRAA